MEGEIWGPQKLETCQSSPSSLATEWGLELRSASPQSSISLNRTLVAGCGSREQTSMQTSQAGGCEHHLIGCMARVAQVNALSAQLSLLLHGERLHCLMGLKWGWNEVTHARGLGEMYWWWRQRQEAQMRGRKDHIKHPLGMFRIPVLPGDTQLDEWESQPFVWLTFLNTLSAFPDPNLATYTSTDDRLAGSFDCFDIHV